MESLVIGFFKEIVNPSFVPFKFSQAFQMSSHASDHSRNSSDRFQQQTPLDPFGNRHVLLIVRGELVVDAPDGCDASVSYSIFKNLRFHVLDLDLFSHAFRIGVVRHFMIGVMEYPFPFWETVIEGLEFLHLVKTNLYIKTPV